MLLGHSFRLRQDKSVGTEKSTQAVVKSEKSKSVSRARSRYVDLGDNNNYLRGGEEASPALLGQKGEYLVESRLESHGQEPVRLVENQHFHRLDVGRQTAVLPLQQVVESPRSRNENVPAIRIQLFAC